MTLIVEEEKIQLTELRELIEESAKNLDLMKEDEEFVKQNEYLKKEIEKAQKNLKATKQSKYRRDLLDFEKQQVFDLTIRRGRSGSSKRGFRSQSRNRREVSPTDQVDEDTPRTVTFLEKEGTRDGVAHTPSQENSQFQKTQLDTKQWGKTQRSGRGGYCTRSQIW